MQWLLGIIVWAVASEFLASITGWSNTTSRIVSLVVIVAILVTVNAARDAKRSSAADGTLTASPPATPTAAGQPAESDQTSSDEGPAEGDSRQRAYLARRGVEVRDGETPKDAARRDIAERRAARGPRRTFADEFRKGLGRDH